MLNSFTNLSAEPGRSWVSACFLLSSSMRIPFLELKMTWVSILSDGRRHASAKPRTERFLETSASVFQSAACFGVYKGFQCLYFQVLALFHVRYCWTKMMAFPPLFFLLPFSVMATSMLPTTAVQTQSHGAQQAKSKQKHEAFPAPFVGNAFGIWSLWFTTWSKRKKKTLLLINSLKTDRYPKHSKNE